MITLCITPTRSCGPPPNVSTRALGLLPRHGMFPMRYQHAIIAKHVCGAHSCALRDRGKRAADPALPSRLQSLAIAGDTIAAKTATRMSHNRADDRPLRWRWQCVGKCWPDTRTTAHSGLHTGHGSSHVCGGPRGRVFKMCINICIYYSRRHKGMLARDGEMGPLLCGSSMLSGGASSASCTPRCSPTQQWPRPSGAKACQKRCHRQSRQPCTCPRE